MTQRRSVRVRRLTYILLLFVAMASIGAASASALGPHDPFGHVDMAGQVNFSVFGEGDGQTHVAGWAGDPDLGSVSGLTIYVYVDSQPPVVTTTHLPRPDVQRYYPRFGPTTGFDTTVNAAPGRHSICVWVVNRGPGDSTLLGCSNVTLIYHTVIAGHIDRIDVTRAAPQRVTFTGWALDPLDFSGIPLQAAVEQGFVPGDPLTSFTTGLARPDVARYYANGQLSGFSVTFDQNPGGGSQPQYQAGFSTCIATTAPSNRFPPGETIGTAIAPVCTPFP